MIDIFHYHMRFLFVIVKLLKMKIVIWLNKYSLIQILISSIFIVSYTINDNKVTIDELSNI